ncbi:MAG TPA: MarC family protein, partial [Myxococcota bacterium]|nr:MarC family protein [Myxococcota bacterium]
SIATVILLAHDKSMWPITLTAVFLAWLATGIIILLGPYLITKMGTLGMLVIERMVGMIAALIAVKMLLTGAKLFLDSIQG